MQPIHDQGTQERFLAGIAEDAEEIKGACGQQVSQANRTAQEQLALCSEQIALCTEATLQSTTSATELTKVVMELKSKRCKDIDFHTLVQKMEGMLAMHNAQFQELTQIVANTKVVFANAEVAASGLCPSIPILEQFALIVKTHHNLSEITSLFQAVESQRRRLITVPNSVCHSECSSFSDSSVHDGLSKSSSNVSALDCTDVSSRSSRKRAKVSSSKSERAVSPERALLQLQVRSSSTLSPFLPTCSPRRVLRSLLAQP